ncbi:unnamed protein product [Calicophoron daubneyi]|uniref:Uncharacterized protein n=1 Tax=Calicophoron daubneyi TaxID=300641 RepID=A0AAV2TWJ2_CALDB
MTSHRSRMQFEHQRQAGLGRNDSSSSLRSSDAGVRAGSLRPSYVEPAGSAISGSYTSSRSRSQLTGVAAAVARSYENQPADSVLTPSSVGSAARQDDERTPRMGSISGYHPTSTLVGKSRSTLMQKSLYTGSQIRLSRSMKASQASVATYKSGRTTIQAEHHDRKVQRHLNSVKFGRARRLYWIAVAFYMLFLLVLTLGLLVICLRQIYMNIILSLDIGEMTGPLLIAGSFLFFGLGTKFYYDAYKLGSEERKRIKYKAASASTVAVTTVDEKKPEAEEKLVSGQTSKNALTRAPIGSRTTLAIP